MRTSRESAAKTRKNIIDVAGSLFSQKGFSAVSISEVMKAAGLTHGGFYGHFRSKDELASEASRMLFSEYAQRWREIARASPHEPMAAIINYFFSSEKNTGSEARCILTSLSQEVGLDKTTVLSAFSEGVRELVTILEASLPDGDKEERRRVAIAMLSSMIGAVTLARSMDDQELSCEVLSAAKAGLAPTKSHLADGSTIETNGNSRRTA